MVAGDRLARLPAGVSGGATWRQSSLARGQRGWKAQPAGGSQGIGTSPRGTRTGIRPGIALGSASRVRV